MTEHEAGNGRTLQALLVAALLFIIVGGTVDIVLDQPADWLSFHVVFEILAIAGALVLTLTLWLGWWRAARAAERMRAALDAGHAERDSWRARARLALEGLAQAMKEQFTAWELTDAEREVALLLLKGYSHKHIAAVTGRSERTARQHAAAVYRKAGLAGRAELAAFFLGDLMLPAEEVGLRR